MWTEQLYSEESPIYQALVKIVKRAINESKNRKLFEDFYLKIKLESEDAKMPTRAKEGDAGMDVYSPKRYYIYPRSDCLIPLDWKCEFPNGYVMIFKEKSGRATKDKLDILSCVVDARYRGIVHAHIYNNSDKPVIIEKDEKISQFIILPCWAGSPIEVTELTESERGSGGFGSTGLK